MASRTPIWITRIALTMAVSIAVVWFVLGWMHANAIRAEFLIPAPVAEGYPLEVVSHDAGRVTVTRTEKSERQGLWGLEGETNYAQVSTIVRVTDATVERGVSDLVGEFAQGDAARMDVDAYTGDPLVAHGISFDPDYVTPSEIGAQPGWFIDGRRSTWVIFIHGKGNDRLTESLRIIPDLVQQGFPVITTTYRNDINATPSESGMRLWGLEEWRDIDAAVGLAERRGAKDVVIVGSGFGASIVSVFLHESDLVGTVRGVIYDSPVLNLEGVVERWSDGKGTPGPIAWLGRRFASLRFGIEWDTLNQVERADQFDVPVLLLTGGHDAVNGAEDAADFGDVLGELATSHRFEQAGHTDLWNIDRDRYESAVEIWLLNLIGPE